MDINNWNEVLPYIFLGVFGILSSLFFGYIKKNDSKNEEQDERLRVVELKQSEFSVILKHLEKEIHNINKNVELLVSKLLNK